MELAETVSVKYLRQSFPSWQNRLWFLEGVIVDGCVVERSRDGVDSVVRVVEPLCIYTLKLNALPFHSTHIQGDGSVSANPRKHKYVYDLCLVVQKQPENVFLLIHVRHANCRS